MIDPVTLAAIRRVARELSVMPDHELAKLGALVAVLCESLADNEAQNTLLLEKLTRLIELQTAQTGAVLQELGEIRQRLEVLTDERGSAGDAG